jgi:hypothetical protein
MVYYLFVAKFNLEDRSLAVSCKDENSLNIRPDNLILTNPSEYITKAYQLNRRPLESFYNKPRLLSQYDLHGKWLRDYPSINAAAKLTGIMSSGICTALTAPNHYAGNYIWRYAHSKKDNIKVTPFVKKKLASDKLYATPISQYDLSGRKIKEFSDLRTAAHALKCKPGTIRWVLLGRNLTAKGYYWQLGKGPSQIPMEHLQKSKDNWEKKICKPVTQYGLDGKKIRSFPSSAEAARQLSLDPMNISTALRSPKLQSGGGYFWQYGEGPAHITVPERLKKRYALQRFYLQPVTRYDKQGKRIAIYKTLKEAAETANIQLHNLVDALTGKLLTCGNSYWRLGKGKARLNAMSSPA